MPTLDMPLEKLKEYHGTNPRPADFDAYWDRATAEMMAVDPQVELRPAEFQAPFAEAYNMFFNGVGGARLHAKVVRSKKAGKKRHPAVLQFHGYGGHSGNVPGRRSPRLCRSGRARNRTGTRERATVTA